MKKIREIPVRIKEKYCKGCGLCVDACPLGLIKISEEKLNDKGYYVAVFSEEGGKCTSCAQCALVCPDAAIEVFKIEE